MNKLIVLQHNVQTWATKKVALPNIYRQFDPHVILINEHSLRDGNRPKIFNYNTYSVNKTNELHAGAAIAIRKDVLSVKLIRDILR